VIRAASLLTLLVVSSVAAQARPDFSGTWVAGPESGSSIATAGDAAFRVGDMGSGWGTPLTITQRRDSLVVEYVFFSSYDLQPPVRLAYALDGSESPNTIILGHASAIQRARLAWMDTSLVITTRHPVPREVAAASAVEVRHTLTMASPTSLVVETTRPGVNGALQTVRTTYTKR
jgi:hypothetical protein